MGAPVRVCRAAVRVTATAPIDDSCEGLVEVGHVVAHLVNLDGGDWFGVLDGHDANAGIVAEGLWMLLEQESDELDLHDVSQALLIDRLWVQPELPGRLGLRWRETEMPGAVWELSHVLLEQAGGEEPDA